MKIYNVDFFYKIVIKSSTEELNLILEHKEACYKSFDIQKKHGKRIIRAVINPKLRELQLNLKKNFFDSVYLPDCVYGFVRGGGYKEYLKPHIGNTYFMRTDIKNFFDSISENKVLEGLSDLIEDEQSGETILNNILNICMLNNQLPQGAITSPSLSNIVFRRLDQRITKYCQKLGVYYSRYADDMLFSSINFDFKVRKWFLKMIKKILSTYDYELNYNKTKFSKDEISLNGFIVGSNIRVSRERIHDINVFLFHNNIFFQEYNGEKKSDEFYTGYMNLALKECRYRKREFKTIDSFLNYLCGQRSFLIQWKDEESSNPYLKKKILTLEKQIKYISTYFSIP